MASETFDFMYRVTYSHGTFKLADANPFQPGVNPVDNNGLVVTDIPDPGRGHDHPGRHDWFHHDHHARHDSLSLLGDVPHDTFLITGSPGHNGAYTFVTLATDSQGHSGFIAERGGQYFFITDSQFTGGTAGHALDLTPHPGDEAICFMAGTMIRTPSGEAAVETLKRGDLVMTFDGRAVPVTWVGRQTVSMLFADPLRVLPVRIKAGALGERLPARDLLVSPDHAILVDGTLVQAGALVNGASIARETAVPDIFTYYHVEVDGHALILAENVAAETFIDNVDRLAFDNWREHHALFPEGRKLAEMAYPRAKAHRQVPEAIREKLRRRAHMVPGKRSIGSAA